MTDTIIESREDDIEDRKRLYQWQKKLMLWTVLVPTALIIVFIVLATIQLNKFGNQFSEKKISELNSIINPATLTDTSLSSDTKLDYIKWYSLTKMEEIAMNKRYNQAGLLIMSRVFTKYLGFFTGMILTIVGSVFIISKISENVSKLSFSMGENIKAALASSSPGIVFGFLGTCLMLASILQHTDINVKDMPMYLNQGTLITLLPSGMADTASAHSSLINQLSDDDAVTAADKRRLADSIALHIKP